MPQILQTLLTTLAALALVVAMILAAARLARRRLAPPPGGRHLRLNESLPLDARRRLHLVECDGTRLLLLTGGATDQILPLDRQP